MENMKTMMENMKTMTAAVRVRSAVALIRKLSWMGAADAQMELAQGGIVLHKLRDGGYICLDLNTLRMGERAEPMNAFLDACTSHSDPSIWAGQQIPSALEPKQCPKCGELANNTVEAVAKFGTRVMQRKPFEMRWQSQCTSCRSQKDDATDDQMGLL